MARPPRIEGGTIAVEDQLVATQSNPGDGFAWFAR